jgi:tetratricopeptide (TPR) repeat protein
LALVRELDDSDQLKNSLINVGLFERSVGHPARSRELLREALTLARLLESQPDEATSLLLIALLDMDDGKPHSARRRLKDSLRLRRSLGDHWGECEALTYLGWVDLRQGVLARAKRQLEMALAIARELGDDWSRVDCLNELGIAALLQGEIDTAEARFDEASAVARGAGLTVKAARAAHGLARVALAEQAYAEARLYLRECLTSLRNQELGEQPFDSSARNEMIDVMDTAARLAAGTGAPRMAIVIAAAADDARLSARRLAVEGELQWREASLATAAAAIGPEDAERARIEGHELSWDATLDRIQELLAEASSDER